MNRSAVGLALACLIFSGATPAPRPAAKPAGPPLTRMTAQVAAPQETRAERFAPQGSMGRKFQRGLANTLLGWVELAYHFRQPDTGQIVPPWLVGLGKGLTMSVRRTAAGLYEIVTFPLPYPDDYLPIVEPEFVWQYPARKKAGTPRPA